MDKFHELKTKITKEQFENLRPCDTIELKCKTCDKLFKQKKEIIIKSFNAGYSSGFCSRRCSNKNKINKIKTKCEECQKDIIKSKALFESSKHHFCSYSCCAKYRNRNKTHGSIRSKIEIFIEKEIKNNYVNLVFIPNDRKLLDGLELDYYFPNLKLAIELNGITHYEPIYGVDRLTRSLDSDKRKMFLCAEHGIELAVINIAMFKNFSKKCQEVVWNEINHILSPLCCQNTSK